MNKRDNNEMRIEIDIINWVEDESWDEEESCKVGDESSPPVTSIKTRVSNNNTYSTIIATLVPLQTTKQQSTYANT